MARPTVQDEFESTTDNAALVEIIRRRADAEGAITFHDFMELALYYPEHGYYASREPMGREGDYLTSPEVNPVFGALVAKQLSQMWELLGRPARFDVVEQGAGTGRLAHDILRRTREREPAFAAALRYRIVDVSASLRRRQVETLSAFDNVSWEEALPGDIEGCVLSNELLDSFPVHRIINQDGQLLELYVRHDGERFEQVAGLASTERIAQYFADLGFWPGEDCVAEVNLHAADWMQDVAQKLARGFALTFDYGYQAEELYAPWRREGTLLCFYRHNASDNPFVRIGRQDLTAHVDYTTLMRVGSQHGLDVAGFTTQARFLAALGIGAGIEPAKDTANPLEEYYARRRVAQELIDPAALGRIRVLAQRKAAPESELWGFADA